MSRLRALRAMPEDWLLNGEKRIDERVLDAVEGLIAACGESLQPDYPFYNGECIILDWEQGGTITELRLYEDKWLLTGSGGWFNGEVAIRQDTDALVKYLRVVYLSDASALFM